MKSLKEILTLHNIDGFDKDGGTDKDTIHQYLEAYEKYLSPFIDKECTLLEIGVWHGGSSLLWHDYLPFSQVCGIDIANQIHESLYNKFSNRYRFYESNAYVNDTVNTLLNDYPQGFDIIIEDGIHTPESNEFALKNYLPMLNKGGVMIIEDVPINSPIEIPFGYSLKYPEMINEMKALVPEGYEVEVIDLTHLKGRFDDILFIIKK